VILTFTDGKSARIHFRRARVHILCSLLFCLFLSTLQAAPKHDRFRGKVVFAGPQAISVQSEKDIYLVKAFRYTSKLEKKIKKSQPRPGKPVTVHYYRGTDLAFKVD